MSMYLWSMLAGSVLVFALYGLRCAKAARLPVLRQRAWETALLSFVFSVLFGTVLARVGYAVLMQELDFEYDWIEALTLLLEFEINVVSFFCGAAGVCLGVLLANRITRKEAALAGMDAFAPFGAVLAAVFRLGELFFGSYGAGGELPEGSPFAFFPFALRIPVQGSSDYWAWAVCVLSAVFALLWAGFAFLRLRGSSRPGYVFSLSLFFLALPQILCESMRRRGMFWLFIHTEQLLCGILLAAVLLVWVLKSGKSLPFPRRWAPMAVLLLGIGLLVGVEFAIDGKLFDLPVYVCYLIMCAVLIAVGWAGAAAAKHWNAAGDR